MSLPADVASPIDLQSADDAAEWARNAMTVRPWRTVFFDRFAQEIAAMPGACRVLELGSGPGFLAEHLLAALPHVQLVLLDFSAPMHAMARERLADHLARVTFVERSFKAPGWTEGLGRFDAVVTNQSVHELRHKRHATALHAAVRPLLTPAGRYLVCDHHAGDGGMANTDLFMTVDEQRAALSAAGFPRVVELKRHRGMVLHGASTAP